MSRKVIINDDGELQSFEGDTSLDYSLQGGGILVEQNGTADLQDCNIFDNAAKEVCSAFEPAFQGGGTLVDCVPCALCRGRAW